VLLLGLFLRVLCLLLPAGDDVNRYLVEGEAFLSGTNVWASAPLEYSDAIGVNHSDRETVYPPLAQMVFALAAAFSFLGAKVWQVLALLFDLGSSFLLYRLASTKRQKKYFWIFWLSPLPMIAFAGGGHYDSLLVFFFLLSLYFRRLKRVYCMALCLGLACGLKYQILPLFLFFFGPGSFFAFFMVFLPVLVLPWVLIWFLYFVPHGLSISLYFETAHWFTGSMEYASCLPQILLWCGISQSQAVLILGVFYLVFLLSLWLFQPGFYKSIFWASLALILVYPTVHYWYLYLILVLWVLAPTVQVWWMAHLLLLAGMLSYNSPGFAHFPQIEFFAYLSLFSPLFFNRSEKNRPGLGLVIPVLSSDKDKLSHLLNDLFSQPEIPEQIVISEGGLNQELRPLCTRYGICHVSSVSGRGQQIFQGLMRLNTDIVLILHADSRVSRNVIGEIREAMRDQDIMGGCIGHTYRESGFWLHLTALINRLRVKTLGLSFGDQGQFFRRYLLFSHQVFEPVPLMEDVELSLRVSEAGRTVVLRGGLISSARQWKGGFFNKVRQAKKIFVLVALYLLRRRLGLNQPFNAYYRYYYS